MKKLAKKIVRTVNQETNDYDAQEAVEKLLEEQGEISNKTCFLIGFILGSVIWGTLFFLTPIN